MQPKEKWFAVVQTIVKRVAKALNARADNFMLSFIDRFWVFITCAGNYETRKVVQARYLIDRHLATHSYILIVPSFFYSAWRVFCSLSPDSMLIDFLANMKKTLRRICYMIQK